MPLLSVQNVCKYFHGNKAVDDVSLEINKGEIVGLIGANGAGKTTLFNCLTGYYKATSGKIIYDGKAIENLKPHVICRMGIGRTFQIAKPFGSLSVLENVAVGAYNKCKKKSEAYDKARQCIIFTGLAGKEDTDSATLNTGEQRRLELARALATDPELLLLDEVMAGLTPTESQEMVELIRNVKEQGVTILMIEHIMPVIMSLSDTVYVLEQGRLICRGTPEEVSQNTQVIESYLGRSQEEKDA